MDYEFEGDLRSYQVEAAELLHREGRFVLADPTGVGKTRTALSAALAQVRATGEKALVVAPRFMCSSWVRSAEEVFNARVASVFGDTPSQRKKGAADVGIAEIVVTNYESIESFKKLTEGVEWAIVIADEGHYLQNRKSRRTKAFFSLVNKGRREIIPKVWILSATPIWGQLDSFWSILNILRPAEYSSFWRFVRRLCIVNETFFGVEISGVRPEMKSEAAYIVNKHVLRRERKDILKDLPPVSVKHIWLDAPKWLHKENAALRVLMKEEDSLSRGRLRTHLLDRNSFEFKDEEQEAVQKVPGYYVPAKRKALVELLKNEAGKKVILFLKYRDSAAAVCSWLDDAGLQNVSNSREPITGIVPVERREELIEEFEGREGSSILIGTMQTLGTGLDMQAANVSVFLEHPDNFAELQQAVGRLGRLGAERESTVYHLIQLGTLDERCYTSCLAKAGVYDVFLRVQK